MKGKKHFIRKNYTITETKTCMSALYIRGRLEEECTITTSILPNPAK